MSSTFGNWLLNELKERDMSQSALARAVDITTAQMSRIISGTRGVGNETIINIAHHFRLPPETVFRAAGILPPTTDDPWAEDIKNKVSHLTGSRREMAERLLNTLLEEQDREENQRTAHPKTTTLKP